jgi:two-component system, NtrC family, nitrogen regulation sensor histidine kinase NtrY
MPPAPRFVWQLAWRVAALPVLAALMVWAAQAPLLPATLLVLGAGFLGVGASLWRLVRSTNLELARLVDALRHRDLAQNFQPLARDAGFPDLAAAFEGLLTTLRDDTHAQRAQADQWQSLVEQVPTPLLIVTAADDGEHRVQLLNRAARRLFDRAQGQRLADFVVYGPALVEALRSDAPSQAVDVAPADDAVVRFRLTQARRSHGGQVQRLVALQPVQSDIDEAQMALARDLVRVLSHEVMNSLTPVTSLAASAAQQAALLPSQTDHDNLKQATAAVARRAQGLMQFVERYRDMARAPVVLVSSLPAQPLADDLATLFRAEWPAHRVALQCRVEPAGLLLRADADLLTQVLHNLLRNAAQASLAHSGAASVVLRMARAPSGGSLIEVSDNGPGIAPALREDVFLPFFTTKAEGSGVGLSLARQVVLAHGGSIRVEPSALGGACLRVVLP